MHQQADSAGRPNSFDQYLKYINEYRYVEKDFVIHFLFKSISPFRNGENVLEPDAATGDLMTLSCNRWSESKNLCSRSCRCRKEQKTLSDKIVQNPTQVTHDKSYATIITIDYFTFLYFQGSIEWIYDQLFNVGIENEKLKRYNVKISGTSRRTWSLTFPDALFTISLHL